MPTLRLPGGPVPATAIIFDKDGVLLDFHRFWGAVTRARVAGLGLDPRRDGAAVDELERLLGLAGARVDPDGPLVLATRMESATLATGFLYRRGMRWVAAREKVRDSWETADSRVEPGSLAPCPGAPQAARALKAAGWLLGVATTDDADHARQTLEKIGILDFFDAIAGGDEVERGKPHPELYRLACDRLGVDPSRTLAVGDGINDLLMGRAAGCVATIGVLSGVSRRADLEPGADVILDGARDLIALIA